MTGSTFKRKLPSGKISWCYQVDLGKDENGKRRRLFKSGFTRKAHADAELAQQLTQLNEGEVVRPDPRSFSAFMQEWFMQHAEPNCSPKTVERYREMAKPLLAAFAAHPLAKVTTLQLERLYSQLLKAGKKDRKGNIVGGLSVKTIRNLAGMVHVMFQTAVRWKLLRSNPAAACVLPKLQRKEVTVVDQQQSEWLLAAAQGNWAADIILLALATGARRGELLALSWPDVDFDLSVIAIRHSLEQTKNGLRVKLPKNGKSRRFALPPLALRTLEHVQEQQRIHRGMYGTDYRSDLNLVFCHPDGNYLRPDSVTKAARSLAKKAGLKGVSLHTLRHGHATLLLSMGISLPAVSKRLGHSSVQVTAEIYAHALPADEVAAANAWEKAMKSAVEGPKLRQ